MTRGKTKTETGEASHPRKCFAFSSSKKKKNAGSTEACARWFAVNLPRPISGNLEQPLITYYKGHSFFLCVRVRRRHHGACAPKRRCEKRNAFWQFAGSGHKKLYGSGDQTQAPWLLKKKLRQIAATSLFFLFVCFA